MTILSKLVDELAHQCPVGILIHADALGSDIERQRGGIVLQVAAGIAGNGINFHFGRLDHPVLVLFGGGADALFFGSGLLLRLAANAGDFAIEFCQPCFYGLHPFRRFSAGCTRLVDRQLNGIRRDELQDLLDGKASAGLSFSVVDHLKWDLSQIFELAVNEGQIERNPARLLFTPKKAGRQEKRVLSVAEVKRCLEVLDLRERLVVKLAVIAGMRPGEIFALRWGKVAPCSAEIVQRVYKGALGKEMKIEVVFSNQKTITLFKTKEDTIEDSQKKLIRIQNTDNCLQFSFA